MFIYKHGNRECVIKKDCNWEGTKVDRITWPHLKEQSFKKIQQKQQSQLQTSTSNGWCLRCTIQADFFNRTQFSNSVHAELVNTMSVFAEVTSEDSLTTELTSTESHETTVNLTLTTTATAANNFQKM